MRNDVMIRFGTEAEKQTLLTEYVFSGLSSVKSLHRSSNAKSL